MGAPWINWHSGDLGVILSLVQLNPGPHTCGSDASPAPNLSLLPGAGSAGVQLKLSLLEPVILSTRCWLKGWKMEKMKRVVEEFPQLIC